MKNSIVSVIATVVCVNLALAAGWGYMYMRTLAAKTSAIGLAEKISGIEAKQDNIRALTVFLQGIDAERAKIAGAFADSRTFVHFIEELERLALISNVKLTIESATLPQSADGFPSFQLKASGSFGGVYRFLSLLQTMRYHVAIDDVRMEKNADRKNWTAALQFQLLSFSR